MRKRSAGSGSWITLLGITVGGLISLLLAAGFFWAAWIYADLSDNLPIIENIPSLLEPPDGILLQPTRVFDRTGEHVLLTLRNPQVAEREYLRYPGLNEPNLARDNEKTLPATVISATIASSSSSLNLPQSLSWINLYTENMVFAERLAAEILLKNESQGSKYELRKKLLAVQMLDHFGRERVIEWYLNHAYFGYMAFGIQSGAQLYFDKPASELNFSESALLIAISENPEIDLHHTTGPILSRQREIIQEALKRRLLSPSDGVQAVRETPIIALSADQDLQSLYYISNHPISPAAIDLILAQLLTRMNPGELRRGGLRILTTLDFDLQIQVECTQQIQIENLQTGDPQVPTRIPSDCQAIRLLPAIPMTGSSALSEISSEIVVLNPKTGQILAVAGGKPGNPPAYTTITSRLNEHPAGSLATLFVYLTGFTRSLSPGSLLWDIPAQDNLDTGHAGEQVYQGPTRLRMAMVNDYLAAAESALSLVGTDNVWYITRQLGIQSPETPFPPADSIHNLFRPLSLLEVSHALSALANQGTLAGQTIDIGDQIKDAFEGTTGSLLPLKPSIILKVDNIDGKVHLDWSQPQARPILTPQLAYMMTNVLSDQTARWPSLGHPNSLEIGRPAAAKFSKTLDGRSNWVIGYTTHHFVGIWMGQAEQVGNIDEVSKQIIQNATTGLWHAVAQYASQSQKYEDFVLPSGISFLQVCDPSGYLPTVACPNVVEEIFLAGNEPVQMDTLYRLATINRDTGRLATIFTPPEQVEQRTFLVVPEEAEKWAELSGWEMPPDTFDPLPDPQSRFTNARMISPRSFQIVSGVVPIIGSAAGEGFSSYRIQYGAGLNPSSWFLLGEDIPTPVVNGMLMDWDTQGLEGLHALQLLVVREDRSVERSTILVTVDNLPPQVEILSPFNGELISISERPKIVLQTQINDNLSIETVIFEMDGRQIAELGYPPYAISWSATTGEHSLRVSVSDQAGNTSETSIHFQVR